MHQPISAQGVRRSPGRRTLVLLRRLGFGYSCFKVFELPLDRAAAASGLVLPDGYRFVELSAADVAKCPFAELRECEWYGGPDSHLFGILRDDTLVSMQCLWFGERYRKSAFWPLGRGDAASVHLVTAASERGKGLATLLKRYSAGRLRDRGFARLYSRIWWTNTASLRVSEKAGWSQVGTVVELEAPWRRDPLRRIFHRRR